jgi:hypothetical protein
VVLKSKHKGVRGKLNSRWNSLLLPLTHRKLLSKAITLENDLRGTLRSFGLKVGIAGSVKVRGTEQGLVENLSDLAVLIFPCPTFPNLLHCMSPLLAQSAHSPGDSYRRSGRIFLSESELALRSDSFTFMTSSSPIKGFLTIRASSISARTA